MGVLKVFELLVVSLVLNVLFSMMGRARNRNNILYHAILTLASNTLWIVFMKELMSSDLKIIIISSVGATIGAVCGQKISMIVENKILATSDDHIKQ